MPALTMPGAFRLYVGWSCRRCGKTGGVARTTVPLPLAELKEPVLRALFQELRRKLVRTHQRHAGCIACVEDFVITRATEEQAQIVGLV